MAIKKRLRKAGSSFSFWFFVEMMHDDLIKGLRKYLASIQPEDVPRMVRKSEFPPVDDLDFSGVSEYAEHLDKIPLVTLVEYLVEARPDLVKAIQEMGKRGADYLAKLRLHLLDLVKHPEKPLAESTDYKPKQKMKLATCDKCGNSWPVPEDKVDSLDKCPFCQQ